MTRRSSVAARRLPLELMLACVVLSACVTINVYFPEAAAEKAADRIIEDVWGENGQTRKPADEAPAQEQSYVPAADTQMPVLLAAAGAVLDFFVTPAHAQADINISTPSIRQLTQSMESRHSQLRQYYASGAIGLTDDGMIEIRDPNAVPLAERNAVRKLVADENSDRANLYREIAAANGHPEWEADIRKTFAERWIAKASSGWWYRTGSGQWTQK